MAIASDLAKVSKNNRRKCYQRERILLSSTINTIYPNQPYLAISRIRFRVSIRQSTAWTFRCIAVAV